MTGRIINARTLGDKEVITLVADRFNAADNAVKTAGTTAEQDEAKAVRDYWLRVYQLVAPTGL